MKGRKKNPKGCENTTPRKFTTGLLKSTWGTPPLELVDHLSKLSSLLSAMADILAPCDADFPGDFSPKSTFTTPGALSQSVSPEKIVSTSTDQPSTPEQVYRPNPRRKWATLYRAIAMQTALELIQAESTVKPLMQHGCAFLMAVKARSIPVSLLQSGDRGGEGLNIEGSRILIDARTRKGPFFHLSQKAGAWCFTVRSMTQVKSWHDT